MLMKARVLASRQASNPMIETLDVTNLNLKP